MNLDNFHEFYGMNPKEFRVQSVRVMLPDGAQAACVTVKNHRITEISGPGGGDASLPLYDVGDAVLMPGLVDVHVHINEPGRTEWEGMRHATQAALAGGITTLCEMPLNASPVTITGEALLAKRRIAKEKALVNLLFYGGVIPGNAEGREEMLKQGVPGLKAFMTYSGIEDFPASGVEDLREALNQLKAYKKPLLVHAELGHPHSGQEAFHVQPWSYQAYLGSRPDRWEVDAVKVLIDLCRETGGWVHIVHLSSAEALPHIREARSEGLLLTVETAPHYLYFAGEDIPDGQPLYKCAPPIRSASNNEKLWDALLAGDIDFVATDHSPAPPSIKCLDEGNLEKAWGGISGLQFFLPVLWTGMRKRGIDLAHLVQWASARPAEFLGIGHEYGKIALGYRADLLAWGPEMPVIFDEKDVLHRHRPSPYVGEHLYGKVLKVWNSVNETFL